MTDKYGDSDKELPLRRRLAGLKMTNPSRDFDENKAVAYWRENRSTFAAQAEATYAAVLDSVNKK